MATSSATQSNDQSDNRMHGAAIIDDKGQETPITDDMVQTALQSILKAAQN